MSKSLALLAVVVCLITACEQESLIFLGKNAYQHPVWEEMLQADVVHFEDVERAFKAYASTHDIGEQTEEYYEKVERLAKSNLDAKGNLISKQKLYDNLLLYRRAKEGPKSPHEITNTSTKNHFISEIPNSNSEGAWKNVGPFGNPEVQWSATGNGALQYVEMHPTEPAIMYACSRNGGLWKTTNYAKNWIPMTDHFSTPNTSCIEVCIANPTTIYLGAADDQQVWYSTDDANTWEDRSNGLLGHIYELQADPTDENRVLAATKEGIYLTIDAGLNWTQKVPGRFTDIDTAEDWSFITLSNDHADIAPTLYFSQDQGDTWIEKTITDEYAEVDRFYLAIHESTPLQVFAYGLIDGHTPTRFIGLWKSDYDPNPDDGESYFNFTRVQHPDYTYPNGPTPLTVADNADGYQAETEDYYGSVNPYSQATWISDFYVSPNNPNNMLTLREKFWGSSDGGMIWEFKPSYGGSNWADNRFVRLNTAKDTIYWCNDGGIWAISEADLFPSEAVVTASGLSRSDYMKSKVVPKNGDICVIEGSQMDVSQMNKDVIITGGQDVGQLFTRNGRDSHVASADVYRGRIKPSDDSKFITGNLLVKLDGGTDTYNVYDNINADYHNADRLYGFTRKNQTQDVNDVRLVRSPAGLDGWEVEGFRGENQSNTGGHNWNAVHDNWETVDISSTGITSLRAGTFEQSMSNAEIAFLGDEVGRKLFITTNLSAATPTWTQLPNAPAAGRYRITTHLYNENIVALATDNGVYLSKDQGATWYKKGTFPESNPRVILLDRNKTEGIYVMTSLTVYYIDEALSDWVEFNKGMPLHQNVDMRMAYYADGDHRLYVGKYGRGIWATPLQSVLEAKNEQPIADFRIHGTSSSRIEVGEVVQLTDLSIHATSVQWMLENGADIINIGDEKNPKRTLSTPGFYKVTLTAYNDNGSSMTVKERYIEVVSLAPLACVPVHDGSVPWYKRYDKVQVNGDNYEVPNGENYILTNKSFEIATGEPSTFYIVDNYSGYNFYVKAWIDYNNDGDFEDDGEEIADSGGRVESWTVDFTPPASAVLGVPLRMRTSGVESTTAPSDCQSSGTRQTLDFTIVIKTNPTFVNSHNILSVNSCAIQTDYTDATNVIEAGLLYSRFNGDLNLENAFRVEATPNFLDTDNYNLILTDLDYNSTYYYRSYLIDESGTHYGTVQSFEFSPYKIPMSESIIALNLGNNEWRLIGEILPEGNDLTGVFIEHGETDFSTIENVDINNLNPNENRGVFSTVTLGTENTYQFRIRVEHNGKSYYSNVHTFSPDQSYCDPVVDNSVWYKRFNSIELNGITHQESMSSTYEDATHIVFDGLVPGESYTITANGTNSGWHNLTYYVYIDLNNDQDFNDYHELVANTSPVNSHITPVEITIPTEHIITEQNLRMRIVGWESSNPGSCHATIGNVKDFSVNLNAPLPLQLLDFSAILKEDMVAINWQTNQEVNTDFFTVERSTDNRTWEVLEKVNAEGNSQQTQVYTTEDKQPMRGLSYYRLKQVDKNGAFTYSSVEVVEYNKVALVRIYPNPVQTHLTIDVPDRAQKLIRIYSIDGQLMYEGQDSEIEVSSWTAGLYSVVILEGQKVLEMEQVVVLP